MQILIVVIAVIVIAVLAVGLYILKQGDAEFAFLVEQRTPFTVAGVSEQAVRLTCKMPFINRGSQDGTIIDAFMRTLLPQEQCNKVKVQSYLYTEDRPRDDGYFEALIVKKGKGGSVEIVLDILSTEGTIADRLAEVPDFALTVIYETVARGPVLMAKARFEITRQELYQAAQQIGGVQHG